MFEMNDDKSSVANLNQFGFGVAVQHGPVWHRSGTKHVDRWGCICPAATRLSKCTILRAQPLSEYSTVMTVFYAESACRLRVKPLVNSFMFPLDAVNAPMKVSSVPTTSQHQSILYDILGESKVEDVPLAQPFLAHISQIPAASSTLMDQGTSIFLSPEAAFARCTGLYFVYAVMGFEDGKSSDFNRGAGIGREGVECEIEEMIIPLA